METARIYTEQPKLKVVIGGKGRAPLATPAPKSSGYVFETFSLLAGTRAQTVPADWGPIVASEHSPYLKISIDPTNYPETFRGLVSEWQSDTSHISNMQEKLLHPAYQRIIGLGRPALELLLRELTTNPDDWFWALECISREDPIPAEHYGNVPQMANDWLNWGRERALVD